MFGHIYLYLSRDERRQHDRHIACNVINVIFKDIGQILKREIQNLLEQKKPVD